MRITLALVATSLILAGSPAVAKDMKSCSADWKTAKAGGTPMSHKDFMSSCLKGGTAVTQTVTTKGPGQAAKTVTTVGTPTKAAPAAPAMAAAAPSTAAPAGATAKCKDGTFSHAAHHSGACSHHGGVASFM